MSPRKPNMLEAFQRSEREDLARQVQGSGEGEKKPAPKAEPEREARARAAPAKPSASRRPPRPEDIVSDDVLGGRGRRGGPGPALRVPRWLPPAGVILLLAMAGTWWIGRLLGDGGESHAREPGGEELLKSFESDLAGPGEALEKSEAPPIANEESLTEDDRRFLDKQNRFTLRAIYFNNDSRGWQRAIATYHHLRASGLPAIAPITQDDILWICVGAEPTIDEKLNRLQARLRALPGPPPQNEPGAFADAFPVNIKDYLAR